MADFRDRLSVVEGRPSSTASKQQISLMNSMDIANFQVAVIGFQTETLSDRVRDVRGTHAFSQQHPMRNSL
eukprot:2809394-Pyramimonas_sp.AAC.1